MEDTLREIDYEICVKIYCVLILVLMEDTLREQAVTENKEVAGLNPCFNGRYSQSQFNMTEVDGNMVLILVLMEDTLRAFY